MRDVSKLIYAELIVLALLQWFKCANTDAFERALKLNAHLKTLGLRARLCSSSIHIRVVIRIRD